MFSSQITLTFRRNQNPFSVMLTPVTIAVADESMGLGNFINSDTIRPTFRATEGVYFSTSYLSTCIILTPFFHQVMTSLLSL